MPPDQIWRVWPIDTDPLFETASEPALPPVVESPPTYIDPVIVHAEPGSVTSALPAEPAKRATYPSTLSRTPEVDTSNVPVPLKPTFSPPSCIQREPVPAIVTVPTVPANLPMIPLLPEGELVFR